jgi:hypothetical protein
MKRYFAIVGVGLLLTLGLLGGCANDPQASARSPYRNPLISSGALFLTLPPEVQNTIRAQVGGAEIDDIRKNTNSGTVVYHIFFRKADLYPTLFVGTNGAVLNPDQSVAVREPSATLKEIKGDTVTPVAP